VIINSEGIKGLQNKHRKHSIDNEYADSLGLRENPGRPSVIFSEK